MHELPLKLPERALLELCLGLGRLVVGLVVERRQRQTWWRHRRRKGSRNRDSRHVVRDEPVAWERPARTGGSMDDEVTARGRLPCSPDAPSQSMPFPAKGAAARTPMRHSCRNNRSNATFQLTTHERSVSTRNHRTRQHAGQQSELSRLEDGHSRVRPLQICTSQ
jgi:hypothetical protein